MPRMCFDISYDTHTAAVWIWLDANAPPAVWMRVVSVCIWYHTRCLVPHVHLATHGIGMAMVIAHTCIRCCGPGRGYHTADVVVIGLDSD